LEEKFQQPLADIKNLCTFADPNDGDLPRQGSLERLNMTGKRFDLDPIQFFDLLSNLRTAGVLVIGRST
jgi:hypothetical protein